MQEISLDNLDDDFDSDAAPPQLEKKEAASVGLVSQTAPPPQSNDADRKQTLSEQTSEVEPLPDNLSDAFALLAKTERMPERTDAEKKAKAARLAIVRRHVGKLQEGLPTLHLDAKALGPVHHRLTTIAKRERLELLARQSHDIRELLDERDKLAAELESLRAAKK
jgi:DNA repair ATPase RecN